MALNVNDYLRFSLENMMKMEHDIGLMLQKMHDEVHNPQLKQLLAQHLDPTHQQHDRLQQCLNRLGGPLEHRGGFMEKVTETIGMAGDESHPVTQGMMKAHEQFLAMDPTDNVVDLHDAAEAVKTEHMEIASYRNLIALAEQLGDTETVNLLQQNLHGEEQMRTALETALPSLLPSLARHPEPAVVP